MPLIHVLDADPELADDLSEPERAVARGLAVARLERLEAGRWEPPGGGAERAGELGLLVVDGLLAREVRLYRGYGVELLSKGDLLRPWDHNDGAQAPLPFDSEWMVLQPASLAILDRRFTQAVGRWPELTAALVSRTLRRSRGLATMLAITQTTRIDARLLMLFWHLADRWGHVTREGVVLPLDVTHETLAKLIGARRPSVTTALGTLAADGHLSRKPHGWLLHGDGPDTALRTLGRRVSTLTGGVSLGPLAGQLNSLPI